MKKVSVIATFVLILFTSISALADLYDFEGTWRNNNPKTEGISSLKIELNVYTPAIEASAQCCLPEQHKWGTVDAMVYGPKGAENLWESADTLSALFRTKHGQHVVIIRMPEINTLQVEVLTHYTDKSKKTDFREVHRFQRIMERQPAGAPKLISPANHTAFFHYPRKTTLRWDKKYNAAGYIVEIDCFECCKAGKWCSETGSPWKTVTLDKDSTSFTFNFPGAQEGRWRVKTIDERGESGPESRWWDFRYAR